MTMTFGEVKRVPESKPFYYSPIHDYTLKEDCFSMVGLFEDEMHLLRTKITEDWAIVEKRRNPDNGFLRIDIVKAGK